jgi:preprotein translocase subunit SecG
MAGPYISNLSTSSSFTASDYVVMAQSNNNNAQRVSAAVMAAFFASYLDVNTLESYYSAF